MVEEQSAVQALDSLGFGSHTKQQAENIKQVRLNYWFDANNALRDIDVRRAAGSNVNDRVFKALVLALYRSVRVSLHRFEKKDAVIELNALKLDTFALHPERFSLPRAIEALFVLGGVLDDLSVF